MTARPIIFMVLAYLICAPLAIAISPWFLIGTIGFGLASLGPSGDDDYEASM